MEYISRSIEEDFLNANRTHKVVLVVGADQIGKTTMMKHLSQGKKRIYVSLDDLHPRTLADTEPDLFFEIFKPPIIIDEAHFSPSILHKIREICEDSDETGLFWLASPPKASFIDEVKSVIGENAVVLKMYGLSLREKEQLLMSSPLDFSYEAMNNREQCIPAKSALDIFCSIWQGDVPKMIDVRQEDKAKYFWHYFYESLMHQVQQSKKVARLTEFSDFLAACAVNICKVLSVRRLALAAGISCPTATCWLNLLIDLGIIYLLEPYEDDELPHLIRKPKLYFTDTGLCSYISNWKTPKALMSGKEGADYFENFIIMELVKQLANRTDDVKLRFFRNSSSVEVDAVIVEGNVLYPFEIKKTAAPAESETKKFHFLESKSIVRGSGGIICTCRKTKQLDKKDYLLPCHIL